ncbi:unnamed protein product, partial [marine sediment metagenome]
TNGDKLLSKGGMYNHMVEDIPLLFYANDQIGSFLEKGEPIVQKSSMLIVGINYINAGLPKCHWLHKSGKLRAVIFQNEEKKNEFERDRIGLEETELISMFGAIDLNSFLEICPRKREKREEDFIVAKMCTPDYRKYVTKDSVGKGEKIHLWQKKFDKELDTKFYSRLLKDSPKNVKFQFMEAHKELVEYFKDKEERMIFYKWNEIPVSEFLGNAHCFLYRTSNAWRDNYPRVLGEAMAAGLPSISENRDGPASRIIHGETGFFA